MPPVVTVSDRELLDALVAGSTEAFDHLVARHQGLVRLACQRRRVGADLDDCIQAVFLVLHRKADQAQRAPALEAWLLVVVRHVCATAQRAARARRRAEREVAEIIGPPEPAAESPALEHLDDCLAQLPERQRTVIAQHYLAGNSRDEVATRLGLEVDTVHQHCRRGLMRLRELLVRRGVAVPVVGLTHVLTSQGRAATWTSSSPFPATGGGLAASYATGAITAMSLNILAPLGLATAAALVLCAFMTFGTPSREPTPHQIGGAGKAAANVSSVQFTGVVKSKSDRSQVPGVRVVAVLFHRGSVLHVEGERLFWHPRYEAISDAQGRYAMTIPVENPDDLVGFDAFKPGFNSFAGVINHQGDDILPDGTVIAGPGHVFLSLSAPKAQVPDLWLEGPAPYLAGTIIDEDGQPIPGAEVEMHASAHRRGRSGSGVRGISALRKVVADAQGRFELCDLPPRPGILDYVKPEGDILHDWPNDLWRNFLQASFWDYQRS